jgi:hypothetical protein
MNSVLRIIILPVRFCSIMRRASSDLSYQLPLNRTCRNMTLIVRNDLCASNSRKYGTIMSASLFLAHTLNLLSSVIRPCFFPKRQSAIMSVSCCVFFDPALIPVFTRCAPGLSAVISVSAGLPSFLQSKSLKSVAILATKDEPVTSFMNLSSLRVLTSQVANNNKGRLASLRRSENLFASFLHTLERATS